MNLISYSNHFILSYYYKMSAIKAICVLNGDNIKGVVLLNENLFDKTTTIKIQISGLTPGKHGLHIHQSGDTRNGCESMGPHYNPFNKDHGGLNTRTRHVGDMGNIIANSNGKVDTTIKVKSVKLRGKYSVIGRSMVVHAQEDDLGKGGHEDSKTTGHSGARVACGIIGIL